ncbi:MAG: type II toxin-antitoxin system PemK/MazF family toxin [Caldilineaceae bacterium]|nr:type II toxin-antitoxin system PemK/MazF family toxin [Caldilineaceae bacterium]
MKRGEIWWINLDPTVGAEIRKTRPAIIVNDDEIGLLPLRVIVPITDWKERYKVAAWMVKLEPRPESGLSKISAADAFQVRSVSQERFVSKLGQLDIDTMTKVNAALTIVLSLE